MQSPVPWDIEGPGARAILSLMWDALRECATGGEAADPVWAADVLPEELEEQLRQLWDAISQYASGREPALTHLPPQLPVQRLLESARRTFLERAPSLPEEVGAQHVVRVLAALERVQLAFERDCGQRLAGPFSGARAGQLLVEAAHDMRSPLTSILFLVDLLRTDETAVISPTQARQLTLVYGAALGLSVLTSDIIDAARGTERFVDAHPSPLSLGQVLHSVRDIVQPIAEEKGLALRLVLLAHDARVGQSLALTRTLLNLATNALKFTSAGEVEIGATETTGTCVQFAVRDTGPGIPAEVMPTLFLPFRRRAPGLASFSRTGLGLSICRQLVTALGGELRVETRPGAGSRFYFELDLPLAPPPSGGHA